MTDELAKKLAAVEFKTTELTAGEAVLLLKSRTGDVASLLQFISARIVGNEEQGQLKPSDLWDLPISEVVQLADERVLLGVMTGMAKMQKLGDKAMRVH